MNHAPDTSCTREPYSSRLILPHSQGSMNVMGTDPIWGVTEGKLEEWWKEDEQSALQTVEPGSQATVVVVTGLHFDCGLSEHQGQLGSIDLD